MIKHSGLSNGKAFTLTPLHESVVCDALSVIIGSSPLIVLKASSSNSFADEQLLVSEAKQIVQKGRQ